MKKLRQYHFWYGAIINTILECNPDACPTLLESTDKRGVFKILTNTSKNEYIIFCKHAFKKKNIKSQTYESWLFSFSDDDKACLKKYYDANYPVFIFFLCAVDELKDSEIAICTYEEYSVVEDKQSITLGREKHKPYFNMHIEKKRETGIHLNRDRICMNSDEIIKEVINFSPEHYKEKLSQKIQINVQNIENKSERHYDRAVSGQAIRYLSLSYRDDDYCPIHNIKMPPIYVHIGKLKDTAYYCKKCGKYMIPNKRYVQLINNLGKHSKSIEFEAFSTDDMI